jgi:hypothetical protein
MSTRAALKSLQDAAILFPYLPRNPQAPARRRLFLTAKAEQDRANDQSATNILCGKGYVHAALDRWVLGDRIFGNRRKGEFLADLFPPPPEIWEIRVREPRVQARLFGRFPEADTLILTGFHTRPYLGDKGSQGWISAMEDCVRQWEAFRPGLPLFSRQSIHDYVTENCDDFPIKHWGNPDKGSGQAGSGRLRRR